MNRPNRNAEAHKRTTRPFFAAWLAAACPAAIVVLVLALSVVACGPALPSERTDSTASSATRTAFGTGEASFSNAASTDSGTVPTEERSNVAITTVSIGSGQGKVTYYIADIQLSQGSELLSAFASGVYEGKAQDTSTIAEANDALVAINGDYHGARDDGIIIRNGVVYRDVPAREGLAIYKDGTMKVYNEKTTSAERLLDEGVWITCSFGPGLVVDGSIPSGIESYEVEANPRHPIQGTNPRTGIGLIAPNHFVFVVVDGRSPGYSEGVTVREFAEIFKGLGCATAYNLDGGGSATLYFQGEVVNNPCSKEGERPVSDILFVK